ncbi:MAG: 1,4-alpha-glucan branching enzyme, partial [Tardiphaga sp.]|nr:1,4-alpha-glucan branching enzyme [Tardiphaga sp.]
DSGNNVFAWMRKGNAPRARCLVIANFSPNVYHDYRVRVPFPGKWREVLNSDAGIYGGSDTGNSGEVRTTGLVPELSLTIPPLAAIFLTPEG